MSNVTLSIAGVPVAIINQYPLESWNCKEHITDLEPWYTVSARPEEIEEEYERRNGQFPMGSCESNCLYRKVCIGMLDYDAFLLHAAVVAVDGEGYVFTAPGGTGKSTHASYWMRVFGDRAVMINGDKPILRRIYNSFYVCGTPWRGKERLGNADIIPLKAICLLERGSSNEIMPAGIDNVLDKIFHQVLMPQTSELVMKQLGLLDQLIQEVPVYDLKCNMSPESALAAYEGICANENETR